jgi:uncharacterized protein YndB with AHSA1/START domain
MSTPDQTKARPAVKRSIDLEALPEDVWKAITEESMLREWLAPEVELDLREGGQIVCRYEDGEERRGTLEVIEEAERLSFEWHRDGGGTSRVEFLVDAVAGGTRLTVIESQLTPATPLLSASWAPRLRALRTALADLVYA